MQINPDYNTSAFTIRSYRKGEIDVFKPVEVEEEQDLHEDEKKQNTLTLTQSFIMTPGTLKDDWRVTDPLSLKKADFEIMRDFAPEIVILGTGNKIHFPDSAETLPLIQAGIGLEVMGTAAACRTYNFLVADGRNVAAALFMIEE